MSERTDDTGHNTDEHDPLEEDRHSSRAVVRGGCVHLKGVL